MLSVQAVDPLLFLRAAACLLVIGSHVQRAELHAEELHHSWNWLSVIQGHFGVWIYFLLSGYLIGKGYFTGRYLFSSSGLADFYTRRLTKVYYPYVLAAIGVFLVLGVSLFPHVQDLLDVMLLRGDRVYNDPQLSYLWTVSNIIQWYLIAPFVCLLFLPFLRKRMRTYLLGAGILVLGYVTRGYYLQSNPVTSFPEYNIAVYIRFPANMDFFLFGVWLNLLLATQGKTQHFSAFRLWLWRGMALLGVVAAFSSATYYLAGVYEWQQWSYAPYAQWSTMISIAAVGSFMYAFETGRYWQKTPALSLSALTPIAWIGIYSYQMYLLQTPIVKWLELECKEPVACSLGMVWYRSAIVVVISLGIIFFLRRAWDTSMALFRPRIVH